MRCTLFALTILSPGLAGMGEAQSLTDAARKTREKREERRKDAAAEEVPAYGNADLRGADESEADGESAPPAGAEEGDESAARDDEAAAARESARQERLRAESERRSEQRREAETRWRRAAERARARIEAAKREVAALEELWLVEGERYVDAEGRTVIRDLDHLRRLKEQAEREMADAEEALAELRSRARSEGVPPGWLR